MNKNPSLSSLWLRQALALVLVGSSLVVLPGCIVAAAGAGAGAVAYVRGELDANLNNDYSKVVDSTRRSIKDLEFAMVSENKDALKAVFVARTALDKKVEITVENSGKRLTHIKIRVGLFGDESLSVSILDKIKAGL
ncbi:MAG TPA: DUF3568 family protein [Lacunisphaera sp.]|jgi:hypothetical protein|nr:DUF3568 family protein [Lacunisphaera sp.]